MSDASASDLQRVCIEPGNRVPTSSTWASATFDELATILGEPDDITSVDADVTFPVHHLKPGETLCRAGEEFEALYVVRSGFLKLVSVDATGNEQVTAFPMRGEVIGLGSVETGVYTADAIALDTCHVVVLTFERFLALGKRTSGVERLMYSMFSREITRRENTICLLGMLSAEARVAAFLLDTSRRFGQIGCSRSSFVLRMTREELGSYLGIKLETVSRALSSFAAMGLIAVDRREVTLQDAQGLRSILEPHGVEGVRARSRQRRTAGSLELKVVSARQFVPEPLVA